MFTQQETYKVFLKDKVKIYAKKGFDAYINNNPEYAESLHLMIQKSFNQESIYCHVSRSKDKDAFYIVSARSKDLQYIAFVLNSLIGKLYLSSDVNRPTPCGIVTTTKLKSFLLVDIPDEYKNPCNELDLLIGLLDKNEMKDIQYYDFVRSFMRDLRDAITMEIYLPDLFINSDVHILDSWVNEYNRIHESDNLDWDSYFKILLESIFARDNILFESMKQFRMLIKDVAVHNK